MKTDSNAVLFMCVVAGLLAPSSAPAQITEADVCSYFEMALANARSITKGDVLVREVFTFDSTKSKKGSSGVVAEETAFHRIVFDYDAEKFLCFSTFKRAVLEVAEAKNGDLEPHSTAYESLSGFVYGGKDKKVFVRHFPNSVSVLDRKDLPNENDEFLSKVGFRDFRLVFANVKGNPSSNKSSEDLLTRYQTGDLLNSQSSTSAEEIEIELKIRQDNIQVPDGFSLDKAVAVWNLNTKTGMPNSRFEVFYLKDGKGMPLDSGRRPRIKFQWDFVNNVYVVKSLINESQEGYATSGKTHQARGHKRMDFHWFSVNEKLDDDLFDESVIFNRSETLKLLDPETTGATDLIGIMTLKELSNSSEDKADEPKK